ncbi:MAG: energy-coupling factor transporter transmembrane protein EcfT [Clostridia bacterium]|nr:energy-coupling factor transporter transmembrane protein EcfT [Clostridia bacterium]
MTRLDGFNPIAIAIYFLSVTLIPMFFISPILLAPSIAGAIIIFTFTVKRKRAKTHAIMAVAFLIATMVNPIYSHKGETVLFLINDTPFTLESFIYGAAAAMTIITTIYWFRVFSAIMTEDKLLYVFGRLSPRAALTLSMAIRYVSLFTERIRQTINAQKAMGKYSTDSIIASMRSAARVFSVTVTWALENGIITAASMKARGYGPGKRTAFSLFKMQKKDVALISATIVLLALTLVGIALGGAKFEFYPRFTASSAIFPTILATASYTLLALIPSIIETEERLRWKYLLRAT